MRLENSIYNNILEYSILAMAAKYAVMQFTQEIVHDG
jgi:hypothetical protein